MKKFQDFQLKSYVLKSLQIQPMRVETLYKGLIEQVDYSYKNFTSEICHLKRRGYIRFADSKYPHYYELTDKGHKHALQPDLPRQKFLELQQRLIGKAMKDDRNVQIAVENALREAMLSGEFGSVTQIVDKMTGGSLSQALEDSSAKDQKIAELEAKIIELTAKKEEEATLVIEKADQKKRRDAETRERISRRKSLAQDYIRHGGFVDARFFDIWQVVRPYWVIDFANKTTVIEILSASNPEHTRGHTYRALTDDEIKRERMRIKSGSVYVERLTIGGSTMKNAVLTW